MRTSILKFAVCVISLAICAISIQAQTRDNKNNKDENREKFVISAKAGGVNSVIGRVMVLRAGTQVDQPLTAQDSLNSGDVVTTGVGSHAELLLNPGSYLRLGENAAFELVDSSLEDLKVRLVKGSAIVEATGGDQTELKIVMLSGKDRVVLVRRGIYRINTTPEGTEVFVRKGRIVFGENGGEVVKGGKKVTSTNGIALTTKLTKQDQDDFDEWSKKRGETLARANERLSGRALNGFLSSNNFRWGAEYGWAGLWTYSSRLGCYTFLPFRWGWASPYGAAYSSYYSIFDYPGRWYHPQVITRTTPNPTPSSWPTGGSAPGGGSNGAPIGNAGGAPISAPSIAPTPRGSMAGPRDPDSGGRRVGKLDP